MENKKYNGWKNFETWLVNLHITNDYDDYKRIKKMTFDEFSDYVNEGLENSCDTLPSMFSDLLRAAFEEVDLHEIYNDFNE